MTAEQQDMGREPFYLKSQHGIVWEVQRDPGSGTWIGVCEKFNLDAIGDTVDELKQCAAEAAGLLIQSLLQEYSVRIVVDRVQQREKERIERGQERR